MALKIELRPVGFKNFDLCPEQIATLGNRPVDVLMFDKSGLSIAMGNASAEVQAQANFVTASNEEEGFAIAVDKFILKAPAPSMSSIPSP